jgi:hypothetical protein
LVRAALAGTAGTFTIDVSPLRSRQVIDIRFNKPVNFIGHSGVK